MSTKRTRTKKSVSFQQGVQTLLSPPRAQSSNAANVRKLEEPYRGALRLSMLSFGIGAASGQAFDEIVKTRVAFQSGKRTFKFYYNSMATNDVLVGEDEDAVPNLSIPSSKSIFEMILVSSEYIATGTAISKMAPYVTELNKVQNYFSRPDNYSYLLILAAVGGVSSLAYPTLSQLDVERLEKYLVDGLGTEIGQDVDAHLAMMTCITFITRTIAKSLGVEGATVETDKIGEAIYYLSQKLAPLNDSASRAVLDYFNQRWGVEPGDNTIYFRSAASSQDTVKFVEQILARVKGLAKGTVKVLFNLIYSVDRYLYVSFETYYYAVSATSFVDADVGYPCALVGGWYGLKYGIRDQDKDLIHGIDPWAVYPVNYSIKNLVVVIGDMFP